MCGWLCDCQHYWHQFHLQVAIPLPRLHQIISGEVYVCTNYVNWAKWTWITFTLSITYYYTLIELLALSRICIMRFLISSHVIVFTTILLCLLGIQYCRVRRFLRNVQFVTPNKSLNRFLRLEWFPCTFFSSPPLLVFRFRIHLPIM